MDEYEMSILSRAIDQEKIILKELLDYIAQFVDEDRYEEAADFAVEAGEVASHIFEMSEKRGDSL